MGIRRLIYVNKNACGDNYVLANGNLEVTFDGTSGDIIQVLYGGINLWSGLGPSLPASIPLEFSYKGDFALSEQLTKLRVCGDGELLTVYREFGFPDDLTNNRFTVYHRYYLAPGLDAIVSDVEIKCLQIGDFIGSPTSLSIYTADIWTPGGSYSGLPGENPLPEGTVIVTPTVTTIGGTKTANAEVPDKNYGMTAGSIGSTVEPKAGRLREDTSDPSNTNWWLYPYHGINGFDFTIGQLFVFEAGDTYTYRNVYAFGNNVSTSQSTFSSTLSLP